MEAMVQQALAFGFSQAAVLSMDTLVLREEVRDMCSADKCRKYGKSWVCPPACGTLEHNRAALTAHKDGLIVQTTGTLEDDFDYEGMQAAGALHQRRLREFYRQLRVACPGTVALGSGGCSLCEKCTYPDAPCRFPAEAMVSMEAYGLWVSDVCTRNGIAYNYGPQTITYTGCYLFPKGEE